MAESFKSFQELECWKLAFKVKMAVREILKSLPKHEQYDIIDNMRRASRSCTRNIAEGFGRFHYQEKIQFCRVSRGSMFEIWDDIITCYEDKYIDQVKYNQTVELIQHALKVLNGYISYLERTKAEDNNLREPNEMLIYSMDLKNDDNNPIT